MTEKLDANRTSSGSGLKSELARFCLPAANRDGNRKLAWVNSICILFLLVGLAGARPASIQIKNPAPLEEVVPTIIEPLPPPPTKLETLPPEQDNEPKQEAPQVVAVTLDAPSINFSVPTIGNLLVPVAAAPAPPAEPMKGVAQLKQIPMTLTQTGTGGDRPVPPYPQMAMQLHQQGTVVLLIQVDENGKILSINFKQSATPVLDRGCIDFVKKHWIFPSGPPNRTYEQPFIYSLGKFP